MRATPPAPTAAGQRAASHGVILATLSLAAFMASLDLFIVNVAFADIGHDFHSASLSDLSWVLNGYAVLYAALLVPLGRLADRYGRLKGFLARGLALFTAASAACAAAARTCGASIAFRGLQAVGAAALTPASLGLLLGATPPDGGSVPSGSGPPSEPSPPPPARSWAGCSSRPLALGVYRQRSRRHARPARRAPVCARLPRSLRLAPPDLLGALLVAIGIGALIARPRQGDVVGLVLTAHRRTAGRRGAEPRRILGTL